MTNQTASEKALSTAHRRTGLLRDLAAGLKQQMFYWGRDVVHPHGNLLVEQGFQKTQSAGLQGTSCYGIDWQDGRIELHGACAGWYSKTLGNGFTYIRPLGKCFTWLDGQTPIPGQWPSDLLAAVHTCSLDSACYPFIDWWLHTEQWIETSFGSDYRMACYRKHKHLPKSRSWLPPAQAVDWLARFRENPEELQRARHFDR